MGDHETALEYLIKAMRIQEQKLPPDRPKLAASYRNVASVYEAMGEHDKAREYQTKAAKILDA